MKKMTVAEAKPQKKEWFEVLAILSSGLSSLSVGIIYAWPSPSILKIAEDKEHYDISFDETSYFMVISPIGIIFSCLIFAKLIDVVGRKWMLMFIVVPQMACWILTATAKSVYVFYVARFLAGIGDACMYSSLPTYMGEVATPKVRGTWGNVGSVFFVAGSVIINGIGSYFSVSHTAYICMSFPIIFACTFAFMPETPYFLLMRGRYDDARKSLQTLRRIEDVEDELQKIKSDVARQMSERGTWKDVFLIRSNRRAISAGAFLRLSQHLAGASTFVFYTQYIFQKAGGNLSASASSMIFLGICTFLISFAGWVIELFGRRRSFFYSNLGCGILLFGEFVYFYVEQKHPEIDLDAIKWIPLVFMVVYMIFFSFGLATIPTLMLSELFSTSIKGKGLCLMNVMFALTVSIIPKIFHLLDKNVGLYSPFLLFSLSCFASTVLTMYIVPETKGRTLEQIQQALKKNSLKETEIHRNKNKLPS